MSEDDNVLPFRSVEDEVEYSTPEDDEVAELNKTFAIVMVGSQVAILMVHQDVDGRLAENLLGEGSFKLLLANRFKFMEVQGRDDQGQPITKRVVKPLATYWLKHPHRRQFKGVIFCPGREVPNYYNFWHGWPIEPRKGDCSKFLAHIRDNACRKDEDLFQWVQGFFADIFQNPGEKNDSSLVLRGPPGTGKSKIAEVIGSLMGRHYVSVSDQRFVTGRFNSHLTCCLLMNCDEAFWAGDREGGKLRDLVSGKKHPIEWKGKEPIFVANYMRLMVMGETDWQVPASMRERRFATLDMGEEHMQDYPYFAAIEQEMNSGGREALLHHFLNFDLTKVNLRKIPRTAALAEQQIASMSTENEWWLDVLRRGELPHLFMHEGKCCCRSMLLHESYLHRTNQTGRRRREMETTLGSFPIKALEKIGLKKIRPTITTRGQMGQDVSVRHWAYQFPSLKECREQMAKDMQAALVWDEQDDWEREPEHPF